MHAEQNLQRKVSEKILEIYKKERYNNKEFKILQGEVKFLTGGKVRDPRKRLTRCDSGTNSTVWMKEDVSLIFFCDTHAPEAYIPGLFLKAFLDFSHRKGVLK